MLADHAPVGTVAEVPHLSEQVELVLLGDATSGMVEDAMRAVADALVHPEKLRTAFHERRAAMRAGNLPEALWLLRAEEGVIGWCGWAPYLERPECWQTTTYFSSSHRGTGLFERSRCRQIHDMGVVADWEARQGRSPGTFMLSIAEWNHRSIRASRRHAEENGWPDTWEQVYEPIADRNAYLFFFPAAPAAHRCYLQN